MDDKDSAGLPITLLSEPDLLYWQTSLPGWNMSGAKYDAETTLLEPLGWDNLFEWAGEYIFMGNSFKYIADVVRFSRVGAFRRMDEPVSGESERQVVFNGSLAIYVKGDSFGRDCGTGLEGYTLNKSKSLWLARGPVEDYSRGGGLRRALLGDDSSVYEQNVEAILRGICHVDAKQESRRFQREHQQWMAGLRQGESGRPLPDFLR